MVPFNWKHGSLLSMGSLSFVMSVSTAHSSPTLTGAKNLNIGQVYISMSDVN